MPGEAHFDEHPDQIHVYRQSHFGPCRFTTNLQWEVFRFSVFQGIGLGDRRADRNGAVRLAAATMGIDLSVQVGRALISYSNQALRTGHW